MPLFDRPVAFLLTPLRALLGVALVFNGIFMLLAPGTWYAFVPTVSGTGPFNAHFVRDIGCAYVAAGMGLVWLVRDARAWPAVMAGAVFLTLHAVTHAGEYIEGRALWPGLAMDLVLVFAPAALAIVLGWPREARRG